MMMWIYIIFEEYVFRTKKIDIRCGITAMDTHPVRMISL